MCTGLPLKADTSKLQVPAFLHEAMTDEALLALVHEEVVLAVAIDEVVHDANLERSLSLTRRSSTSDE